MVLEIALGIIVAWLSMIVIKGFYRGVRKFGTCGWRTAPSLLKSLWYFIRAVVEEMEKEFKK